MTNAAERVCVLVHREYTLKYGGDIKWSPKKFFVLFLPLFRKLKMIQEKIKSKRFISAVTLSLSH